MVDVDLIVVINLKWLTLAICFQAKSELACQRIYLFISHNKSESHKLFKNEMFNDLISFPFFLQMSFRKLGPTAYISRFWNRSQI